VKRTDLDILHSLAEPDVRGLFRDKLWERAKTYHRHHRVHSARRRGTGLTAQVQGTRLYDVHLRVERRHLHWKCTCVSARSGICKHLGAALLQ